MKFLNMAFVAGVTMSVATVSTASTIDFESFSNGDLVTSVSSTDGAITAGVSATNGAGEARIFDSTLTGTADKDLQDPFKNADGEIDRPGNVLIIQEEAGVASAIPDDNADGGTITFMFDKLVDFLGFKVLDDAYIEVTSDTGASTTAFVEENRGWGVFDITDGSFDGITSLTFNFVGNGSGKHRSGAIDDLQLSVPAVPVPAALPMLMLGLGGLGVMARRRRTRS